MSGTFDWVEFPEGRARFSGIRRGWDEQGRHTFSIELRGAEYFGQIKRNFPKNDDDYEVAIDAFGYGLGETVGMPGPGVRDVFTADEVVIAKALVTGLVQAGFEFVEPPSIFLVRNIANFTGRILFDEDWVLAAHRPVRMADCSTF
ncbi:hypothetical protein [Stenotrophomonas rhizophila]|uniref:hypothetical protein n=1 Tax=Stenotrophomonas rhizophila TaxID=216778 RepID=UPI001E4355EB|nr:hypothetical protein [Stenotrophomonas rhizophila]MCC7633787.1 hypothetical protein [Stenotrophomonas rhizophila]MCC7663733.1 hypothetical protein [Stenotrophomonas rhizophila]